MRLRRSVLGVAAGLVLAVPAMACAHPGYHHGHGHGKHRYEKRHDRHHDRWDRHHDRRDHRRDHRRHHRDERRHRHHGALGKIDHPRAALHARAPWYCGRCRTGFHDRDRFAHHLHRHHRVGLTSWWGHVVRTPWGWAYLG